MLIPHIVLYTFPKVLILRLFYYSSGSFIVGDHLLYSHDPDV